MFFILNDITLNNLYQNFLTDELVKSSLVSSINSEQILLKSSLNSYYSYIVYSNYGYIIHSHSVSDISQVYYNFYTFFRNFLKITFISLILYFIFFLSNIQNYISQIKSLNSFSKLFILNESEKEVGPVDDFFLFAILFLLTLVSFIITSFVIILVDTNLFIWSFVALFIVSLLILTVPLNLFLDYGLMFFAYIRGSASSGNLLKEVLFDMISTFTVFIRFVIQNIRFLFIFSAIFELLEWVFSNNSSLFLTNYIIQNNVFVNTNLQHSTGSMNILIINSLLFIVMYLYYFLHLLFLLLVQITIYIGISVWLFFFLYSTKFLTKYEKYFFLKK